MINTSAEEHASWLPFIDSRPRKVKRQITVRWRWQRRGKADEIEHVAGSASRQRTVRYETKPIPTRRSQELLNNKEYRFAVSRV